MSENFIDEMIEKFNIGAKKSIELQVIEYIHENKLWHFFLNNYKCEEHITDEFKEEFHFFWISSGEHIRKEINNDRLLVNMLREVLPSYRGKELTLYRGENIQRFEQNNIGLCWTSDLAVAKMFSTRNACDHGGIILSAKADKNNIIAGIHPHSKYLSENEFTVDPFKLKDIKIE